ncbi:hypothetical protein BLOT_016030 [Blomia tropicalis]|nr:hypothetical protein BLOT_016030 [Blomia tropicalis]
MGDLIIGAGQKEVLVRQFREARSIFEPAGFQLHKIHSNIPNDFGAEVQAANKHESTTILGLTWNKDRDQLSIRKVPVAVGEEESFTKRKMLSRIGELYDPLGIIEPMKIEMKLLFREVIRNEWDESLDQSIIDRWNQICEGWPKDGSVMLNRFASDRDILYGFSDASTIAYGYCIYLGKDFVYGKSKLTNGKNTIVMNELIALVELSKAVVKLIDVYRQHDHN